MSSFIVTKLQPLICCNQLKPGVTYVSGHLLPFSGYTDIGGVDATSIRRCAATFDGADGVVRHESLVVPEATTPSAALRWASPAFY